MVPIRDTGLIGRKIDCPKCKYRFVVEEPAEEEDDEAPSSPAKKTKPGATGVTNKKPANGKAAGKPTPKRRGDDDEDDDEDDRPKKKKSGGGSGILIIGLGLGAVAIVALAIGAYFLFAGGEPKSSSPTGGPMAGVPGSGPGGNAPGNVEMKKEEGPKKDVKPVLTDATNLLPNDSQMVINLPVDRLLGNAAFKKAALMTPGSFGEVPFQRTWGISPSDVSQVVLALNPEKKTVFSVMRTDKPVKEDQIVAALKLKAEAPIGNLRYYLLKKPLDSLSTFLLKANETRDKVALHFLDNYTVVCADLGPMQQFLQEKGHPKHLTELPAPPEEKPQGGAPGMGGMPGMPGMPGGPQRPGGPQPGGPPQPPGGPKPPGAGMAGGNPGAPPPGNQLPTSASQPKAPGGGKPPAPGNQPGVPGGPPPMPPGGGVGGFRPPGGFPPGIVPPGMSPGGGDSDSGPAGVSSSYLTIDPHMKAVLDQVEKIDKKEGQVLLLSFAYNTSLLTVDNIKKSPRAGPLDVSPLTDASVSQTDLDKLKKNIKAIGKSLTELSESKFSQTRALSTKDEKIVSVAQKEVSEALVKQFERENLDMLEKTPPARGNFPGMPGMQPGMPMPPNGGGFPQPGPGGQRPNGFPQPGPGGFPQPGPGGFPQPGGEEDKKEEKGKDGDYRIWTKDKVVAVGINQNLQAERYQKLSQMLEEVCKKLRANADMCDDRSRIHELAAATQEFLKKEGHFPRGTLPRKASDERGIDWRPDQRLSWMVELLPYVANGEFKDLRKRIEDASSWNDPPLNQFVGTTVIPQFLAPLPPDKREGYYIQYPAQKNMPLAATHFVGMAGVGLDAAEYRAGDAATAKLRGIFGYDRETKADDIKDGLGETILLIQVPPAPKSPWIAGGGSTVRGVSTDLDCLQPFVCAKYQGKDGTFAIMADGKVRFIPETIPAKTFQAMCTIAGGEKIKDIDEVAPEVPAPEDFQQPELKAEQPVVQSPAQGTKGGQGRDLQNLQGIWTLVGGEAQGKPIPAELAQQLGGKVVITGDKYVLSVGKENEGGTVTFDETKTPKTVDARITEGNDKGKSQLGIYSLSGDELKLSFAHPGQPRPSSFATRANSTEQVFVFKRAKR